MSPDLSPLCILHPSADVESRGPCSPREETHQHNKAVSATAKPSQAQAPSSDDSPLYSPLSLSNYQSKFGSLIEAERESHNGILRERYTYIIIIIQQ